MQTSGIVFYVSYDPKTIVNPWRESATAAQLRARNALQN